jgi:hypothetical protein
MPRSLRATAEDDPGLPATAVVRRRPPRGPGSCDRSWASTAYGGRYYLPGRATAARPALPHEIRLGDGTRTISAAGSVTSRHALLLVQG